MPRDPWTCCVLMLLGPNPAELERARDTIASLLHWEPAVTDVIVVDDPPPPHLPRSLGGLLPSGSRVALHQLQHPRLGRGFGMHGGLAEGVLTGLGHAAAATNADLVLKIDSDALCLGPFAERLRRDLSDRPNAGLAGAFEFHYDGAPRRDNFAIWGNWWVWLGKPLAVFRPNAATISLWASLFGRRARVRRLARAARARGLPEGANVQGGAYAVTRPALRALLAAGAFAHGEVWRNHLISEDIVLSLYVAGLGLDLVSLCGPGQVFAVRDVGLPAPLETLLAADNALIHSVKGNPTPEDAIRAAARALRG